MRKFVVIGISVLLILSIISAFSCGKKPVATLNTRLTFTTQPGTAPAGASLSIEPVVAVTDANGNTITNSPISSIEITIALKPGSGTSGAVLSGKATAIAVNGVATFPSLSIDKPGAEYVLVASGKGVLSGASETFNISGKPAKISFTTEPQGAAAGLPFETQPELEVQDIFGSKVTDTSIPVTLTITPRSGVPGATIKGTTTVNAVNGVVIFKDVSIDKPGLSYTLLPVSPGTESPTSRPFNVSGAAATLIFSQQPIAATAGSPFSINPEVTVLDANGAVAINSTVSVTIALASSSSAAGLILSGKTTVNAVKGVATFSDLIIDQPKTNCVLIATSPVLVSTQSNPFDVAKPQPTTTTPTALPTTIPTTPTTGTTIP